jgi:structural maintenance of chromosome 4
VTYLIDGVKVSQEEVVGLLKDKGIDLTHNRFLILQGEVE